MPPPLEPNKTAASPIKQTRNTDFHCSFAYSAWAWSGSSRRPRLGRQRSRRENGVGVSARSGTAFDFGESHGPDHVRGNVKTGHAAADDRAAEPRVVSPIHLAHPASAQRGDDFIRPEFLARGEGHPRAIIVPTKRFQLSPSSAQANSRGVTTSQSTPPVSGDRRFPGSGG